MMKWIEKNLDCHRSSLLTMYTLIPMNGWRSDGEWIEKELGLSQDDGVAMRRTSIDTEWIEKNIDVVSMTRAH